MESTLALTTARLVLRPPSPGDAAALADYHARNRDHLAPWEPARPPEFFTAAWWQGEIARIEEAARAGTLLSIVVLARSAPAGPIIGRCTLSNIVRGPFQAAHLGFSLDRDSTGKGIMHEALAALVAYAFEDLGLHRIMANYMPGNARSARLLRRLGFASEGFARDYLQIAGAWEDHVLTSLLNPAR
jgi:ribosomal-protein-alanine N-acetyltransferase